MEATPLNCITRRQQKLFYPLFVASDSENQKMEWINSGGVKQFEAGPKLIAEL